MGMFLDVLVIYLLSWEYLLRKTKKRLQVLTPSLYGTDPYTVTECDRMLDSPVTLRRGAVCKADGRWIKELMRVSPDQERARL